MRLENSQAGELLTGNSVTSLSETLATFACKLGRVRYIGWLPAKEKSKQQMVKAAIGIGSNIGDPIANVKEALNRLGDLGKLVAESSLYRTKPWGVVDQPDFINAAAIIDVECTAEELLEQLLSIERSMGRERLNAQRWGPRAIDLDVLTYGEERVDKPKLTIPHRHMLERAFVLVPLAEIDKTYESALQKLSSESVAEVERLS